MGDAFGEGYPADGETPVHEVASTRSAMDATAVTNAQFATFVKDTGYVTGAEEFGLSAVFHLARRSPTRDGRAQAGRRARRGGSAVRGRRLAPARGPAAPTIGARQNHPVVHVDWHDAQAYCRLGRQAAAHRGRVGVRRARRPGRRALPLGRRADPARPLAVQHLAGHVPDREHRATTASSPPRPAKTFAPNGYGLYSMAGNVWEWCADWFSPTYYADVARRTTPTGPATGEQRVMRGGSYLCHDSYCNRYRVAARSSNTPESTAGNIGFRCAG